MIKSKFTKVLVLLLSLVLIMAAFTGCIKKKEENIDKKSEINESNKVGAIYPLEVEDDFGNKVTIEKEPLRIVSLAPSHTEILFAIGLGNRVVGVTNYCNYPEEAKSKEKVGDFFNVNVEKIIELAPDLVIQYGQGKEEVNKRLKEAGIKVLSYEPESIDDVINLIDELGKITNRQRAAKMTIVDMMAKRDFVLSVVSGKEKVKVFYELQAKPLMTAGPGSFIDELINLAGGENIAKDAKGKYPQFDLEQLIERNPDVYLTSKYGENKTVDSIKSRDGYENINAIKNDRVYILDPDIISRPGPRIVDGLELIARKIHPEAFK
ncbi:ABC transporter substrate-binding protein [Caloranaerobacter azorensis]|uniref:Iron complex transport system substrate-binding protein n=2 Tax=Caloranaerobacter azorensis TaxID=116090 RepID=A0A1M5UBZ7_9FIRM|nr:cobalamin-binding protein [Caloranaerobacter azorensis]QIB26452.1 cobalamin-binding protein [Caloranaerobacter azorensis]SHH60366.1 iron complex transport system substrate-binding protein [Caloranaerobacter azorensis DSM 13643]